MKLIRMDVDSPHDFRRTNPVTLEDKEGFYDLYECEYCRLTGKRRNLAGELHVDGRLSDKRIKECPDAHKKPTITHVTVRKCNAVGGQFDNLKPGSIHEIIPPPERQDNTGGLWVMGVGEPVKLLFGEFAFNQTTVKVSGGQDAG